MQIKELGKENFSVNLLYFNENNSKNVENFLDYYLVVPNCTRRGNR